ncbi:MAG: hypothetical protein ABI300_05015 [Rhodanobacter sp.]
MRFNDIVQTLNARALRRHLDNWHAVRGIGATEFSRNDSQLADCAICCAPRVQRRSNRGWRGGHMFQRKYHTTPSLWHDLSAGECGVNFTPIESARHNGVTGQAIRIHNQVIALESGQVRSIATAGIGIQRNERLLLRLRPHAFCIQEARQGHLNLQRYPSENQNTGDHCHQRISQWQ